MPVYKKKETSHRATLSWDGYSFPWGVEVETPGYVRPHAELDLVSDLPAPPPLILMQETINLDDTTPVTIEVPACAMYLISIECATGSVACHPNTEDATPVQLEKAQKYYTAQGIARGLVASWVLKSTTGAACNILIEYVK